MPQKLETKIKINTKALYQTLCPIIDFIEAHLDEPLPLDRIAATSTYSRDQLTRLFKLLTGMGLADYVRARKLATSLSYLKQTEMKIIDIACYLGFEHEQSYIRAFQKAYGISPHKYRTGDHSVIFMPRLSLAYCMWFQYENWPSPIFVQLPGFKIHGVALEVDHTTVHRDWHESVLKYWRALVDKHQEPSDEFWGLALRTQNTEKPVKYITGLKNLELFTKHKLDFDSLTTDQIFSGSYATFRFPETHKLEVLTTLTLQEFLDQILRDWPSTLGYTCRTPLTQIIDHFKIINIEKGTCEYTMYLPLIGG